MQRKKLQILLFIPLKFQCFTLKKKNFVEKNEIKVPLFILNENTLIS